MTEELRRNRLLICSIATGAKYVGLMKDDNIAMSSDDKPAAAEAAAASQSNDYLTVDEPILTHTFRGHSIRYFQSLVGIRIVSFGHDLL